MASNHLLRQAAAQGDLAKVTARLAAGDDLEGRHQGTGRTPLLEAAIAGHPDVVELLLDSGADLTASCTAVGHTALGWAANQGHAEVARVLLAHGADPNLVPGNSFLGHTPLIIAAMAGHTEIVDLLLAAGADPARVDNRGHNALWHAEDRSQGETAARLREAGSIRSEEPPAVVALGWPELGWDPSDLAEPGAALPDEVTPAQVVRSYVLALYDWETRAWQELEAAGESFDFAAALAVAERLRDVHCTTRQRSYSRASIGALPELTPEIELVEETQPTRSRAELLLRYPTQTEFVHEYETLFVCLRKHEQWRIDSAKNRMLGTSDWEQVIL